MIKIAESYFVDGQTGRIVQPGERYEVQEESEAEKEKVTMDENLDKGKRGKRQASEE